MGQAGGNNEKPGIKGCEKIVTGDDLHVENCRMTSSVKNIHEDEQCNSGGRGISAQSLPVAYKEYIDNVCFEMVFVPGGEFVMGSDAFCSDERPAHEESVGSFWLCKTEVTIRHFKLFIDKTI